MSMNGPDPLRSDPIASLAHRKALEDVVNERGQHFTREGWTVAHDDAHRPGDLSRAGAAYALMAFSPNKRHGPPGWWPWATAWWKPATSRRDLVKAAALMLAEIERIDRESLRLGPAGAK